MARNFNKEVVVKVTHSYPVMMGIFVVLLILKLSGTVDWSWWLITLPLWFGIAVVLSMFAAAAIAGSIAFLIALLYYWITDRK